MPAELKRKRETAEEVSFPKNKIKILLLEGVSARGIKMLQDAGFQ
eukprot:CAMPEP_0204243784 /NCGR_PEP_ID=MMETSP0361-20130328/96603_1 /ASSEMBLY_ACC=CAM_ASM_000343 /TAXON_ID=268821 /ORGANISM="Scrippsiella Hangoei, Strain SHTV-5" /LENGTH=44 /DNA_ID= /DNA_START= /DNA_END= /DNA_ORIENTATION=